MKDILGNEIKVNNYIIYAYNLGRSADLKIGKIIRVTNKLQVAGVSIDYYNLDFPEISPNTRIVALTYPERCCILDSSKVHPKVKEVLDNFEQYKDYISVALD